MAAPPRRAVGAGALAALILAALCAGVAVRQRGESAPRARGRVLAEGAAASGDALAALVAKLDALQAEVHQHSIEVLGELEKGVEEAQALSQVVQQLVAAAADPNAPNAAAVAAAADPQQRRRQQQQQESKQKQQGGNGGGSGGGASVVAGLAPEVSAGEQARRGWCHPLPAAQCALAPTPPSHLVTPLSNPPNPPHTAAGPAGCGALQG